MITKEQRELIKYLCSVGYGWAAFAVSVEKQGWCSDKQHQTMIRMKRQIRLQQEVIAYKKRQNKSSKGAYPEYDLGGTGCSDSEAMGLGDYF